MTIFQSQHLNMRMLGEQIMNKKELLAFLNEAIDDEDQAIDMYLKAAEDIENPIIASVLKEILAVQEMEHKHKLEELKKELEEGSCEAIK